MLLFSVLKPIIAHNFEKDDDSNGHIDYITAAAVCSKNYTKAHTLYSHLIVINILFF